MRAVEAVLPYLVMLAAEVRGLVKTYRGPFGGAEKAALRGVDLFIEQGVAFGLIGPNGAGKTTFIKALLGIVRPTKGSIRALGGNAEDPAIRARIGYLPERLQLPHAWVPPAFLCSVARLKGVRNAGDEVERQLARVGLTGDRERRIGGFSKGMKQRLGLAAALLGAPDLLVLDEPTDGIDPLGRVEIRRILAEERSRGAAILLNSHLLSETERVCDRVGILAGGALVKQGGLEELCGASTRWRVRFEGDCDEARLRAIGFDGQVGDGALRCDAPDARALNRLLDAARAEGAMLVELGRDFRDLEDVLAEAVRA
jgi:ABC-2 type transport system ATP-binding protein